MLQYDCKLACSKDRGHRRRGHFPVILLGEHRSTLSIFIDESGDFGPFDANAPYYLITMVFHDQSFSIQEQVAHFNRSLSDIGLPGTILHAGPIIRREDEYHSLSLDQRRQLLYRMRNFYQHIDITHHTFVIDKKHLHNVFELNAAITKELNRFFLDHLEMFQSYSNVIVYYDNGQRELNLLINTVLNIHLNHVAFRKAYHEHYRLLQVADFICTLELLGIKSKEHRLSKSEELFFYKPQELKKTFLKLLPQKAV